MSASSVQSPAARPAAPSQQATLDALVAAAGRQVEAQLAAMAERCGAALADLSEPGLEAKEVYRRVKSGRLLKDNGYAFCHLATAAIERVLRRELERMAPQTLAARVAPDALCLVPLEEIDSKLAFAALARPFDIAHSDALATLAVRLGMLLGRGVLRADSNPFRPEVFLEALDDAWREFEPDAEAHGLILPLLRPELLFDFGPVYEAVTAALARKEGQPGSVESYRIQKTDDSAAAKAARAASRAALADQLRQLFGDDGGEDGVPLIPELPGLPAGNGGWRPSAASGFGLATPPAAAPAPERDATAAAWNDGAAAPGAPGTPPAQATAGTGAQLAGGPAPGFAAGAPGAVGQPANGFTQAPGAVGQPANGFTQAPGATGQPANGYAQAPGATGHPANGFAQTTGGTGQPANGYTLAPGATGHAPSALVGSGGVAAAAAPGFALPAPGLAYPAAGFAPAPASDGEGAPGGPHAASGTAHAQAAAYAYAPEPALTYAGAHAAQDGVEVGGQGALQAVLSGLRPGVVAPLLDLLARIGPQPMPDAALPAKPQALTSAANPQAGTPAASHAAAPVPAPAAGVAIPHDVFYLPRLKQSLPKGSLSRGDERTLDLLSRVFETVLLDDSMPSQTRELLQLLQVPVLKAALADRNFFFEQAHPARRLVDLLSRMGWEQRQDADDPMVQAMRRSVARVSGADGTVPQAEGFAAAVAELEASLALEDSALESAIATPVANAIQQERMALATRAAREAVALRIQAGSGGGAAELVDVVSGFLEQRWTTVLTFAYSIEEQKPGAVGNATRAMDDLIWSVKPKPTQEQRKSLIARLPRLLSTLNKWLDAIKWQDADRLQFFARLAEYHASIVRAPIELSPERQLELAVEAAQQDALRRVELENAAAEQAQEQRQALSPLDGLERGMWLEFRHADGARKVKLAWVSPLRTLFIFSGAGRREAFSLPAEKLVAALHAGSARVLAIDGVVGQVLSEAMGQGAVNDASMLAAASRAAAG